MQELNEEVDTLLKEQNENKKRIKQLEDDLRKQFNSESLNEEFIATQQKLLDLETLLEGREQTHRLLKEKLEAKLQEVS